MKFPNQIMSRIHKISLCTAAAFASVPFAAAQDIQAERERWALHARSGEAQLAESVAQLGDLYAQSGDAKVRADLIALLVRQEKPEAALAVCAGCPIESYSADELENLAKAARDIKQYPQAAAFYRSLQLAAPQNQTGYLGSALVAVDSGDYAAAQQQIESYLRRFGNDKGIRNAQAYLKQRTQPLTERLAEQQRLFEADPANGDHALQLYRTAAQLQLFPQQERIMAQFPERFGEQDRLWLQAAKAVVLLRGARQTGDPAQIREAYESLGEVVGKSEAGSPLHTQALRDRVAAAVALGNEKQALRDYRMLEGQGRQPDYVQDGYAKALLMAGSPRQARKVLHGRMNRQMAVQGKLDPELVEMLAETDADLMEFSAAQEKIKHWNPKKYTPDFTHTVEVENPYYDTQYFWNTRLEAWNGNVKGAHKLMQNWLGEHPADPWAMVLDGELSQIDGHEDRALARFDAAREYLGEPGQKWIDGKAAAAHMSAGNWRAAARLSAGLGRDDVGHKGFWQLYDEERAARLEIGGMAMKATSPADGTEWAQTAKLYSPRSSSGHRAYIAQQHNDVPNHGRPLRAGRVGAGAEINLYPVVVHAEAGHGTQLNGKAYAVLGADWRVNDFVGFTARAASNSVNTPVKALWQEVYADEYTLGAEYTHSAATRAGMGASVMKFDDGNTRQTVHAWLSHDIFQYNRWKLGSSLWTDYSRNKDIPSAFYYNPENSKTVSGELALSYTLPLDNGIRFTQTAAGSAGRYRQAGHPAENTWQIKYGHDWRFGRRAALGYEFGRRRAMYDGSLEYQNFGGAKLSVKFY
ncbi:MULTISPECIES: poly-beta-1,6 N-acetyl-D-glucosamine export porin PgaA [unclassified Neisseria]|uniref:poly-beta-1,6 N-acetyl-D-glucosamine export porin PgaA n=1 Tax=unclassified Neisseria TaxID=2623750 RepID=UPI001D16F8A5|nr:MULTISPECIES: poly-beta-1,6 N-acetyl-D-glucosamine export porin PgaA [unclassified Neisseria]